MQFKNRNTQINRRERNARSMTDVALLIDQLSLEITLLSRTRDDWVGKEGQRLAQSLRVWSALAGLDAVPKDGVRVQGRKNIPAAICPLEPPRLT